MTSPDVARVLREAERHHRNALARIQRAMDAAGVKRFGRPAGRPAGVRSARRRPVPAAKPRARAR